MKNSTASILLCVALVLAGCGEKSPNMPGDPDPPFVEDTCYNDDPLTYLDSAQQQWPSMHVQYEISRIEISAATGWWSGVGRLAGWSALHQEGVFIYDPQAHAPIWFLPKYIAHWSPDGALLLCDNGFYSFEIYDVATRSLLHHLQFENAVGDPRWSFDGKYVYYNSAGGLWRVKLDGKEAMRVVPGAKGRIRELDDTRFVGFDGQGLFFVDSRSGEWIRDDFPLIDGDLLSYAGIDELAWDISPDRTRILVDIGSKFGFIEGREIGGLFLFDLEQKTARKVLPQQYWGSLYWPRWISNDRFYGSYFCRTRTPGRMLSMVWEYDLDGTVIRQVTFPWMHLYPK